MSNTSVSITVCDGEICMLHKSGGAALSPKQFEKCLNQSFKREISVKKLIKSVFNKK